MAGLRQNPSSNTTRRVDVASSARSPVQEPPLPSIDIRQIRIMLHKDEREKKTEAIRDLLSLGPKGRSLIEEVLPAVCAAIMLESGNGQLMDQDLRGRLLSVLVHAAELGCVLDCAEDAIVDFLSKGTVAQRHSAAMAICGIEDHGGDISSYLRPMIIQVGAGGCDQTAKMILSKALISYAMKNPENAQFILGRLRFFDPHDFHVGRIISKCQAALGIPNQAPQIIKAHDPAQCSKTTWDEAVSLSNPALQNDGQSASPLEAVAEGQTLDIKVAKLFDDDPNARKNALKSLSADIKDADSARDVLALLQRMCPSGKYNFIEEIRAKCYQVIRKNL